ncbi:MAG: hypothetical protein [Podoviridae sp. ctQNx1]|nr:MAG: hypothetical protein [Podoviridae sp. ctQNx1]UOF78143.1 MHC class i polypeptidE-related sequence systeM-viral protein compleX [Caudoviricetes sp.]
MEGLLRWWHCLSQCYYSNCQPAADWIARLDALFH